MPHPKQAEYSAKWRAANPDRKSIMNADWKARNRDKVVGYHLKEKYNITLAEYDAMLLKAGSACEICRAPVLHAVEMASVGVKACVDHCHDTGLVRGILCHQCNRQLSFFEKHADAARRYLTKET